MEQENLIELTQSKVKEKVFYMQTEYQVMIFGGILIILVLGGILLFPPSNQPKQLLDASPSPQSVLGSFSTQEPKSNPLMSFGPIRPSPTPSLTPSPSPSPTQTPTFTPTQTPSPSPTPNDPASTSDPSPSPTASPSPISTTSPSPTSTQTPSSNLTPSQSSSGAILK